MLLIKNSKIVYKCLNVCSFTIINERILITPTVPKQALAKPTAEPAQHICCNQFNLKHFEPNTVSLFDRYFAWFATCTLSNSVATWVSRLVPVYFIIIANNSRSIPMPGLVIPVCDTCHNKKTATDRQLGISHSLIFRMWLLERIAYTV